MKKVYCDFCKREIHTIYHEIAVDSLNIEICDECNARFVNQIQKLLREKATESEKSK